MALFNLAHTIHTLQGRLSLSISFLSFCGLHRRRNIDSVQDAQSAPSRVWKHSRIVVTATVMTMTITHHRAAWATASAASTVDRVLYSSSLQGGHKPGILGDFSEHGKLREFCATWRKNCNKQSIFSSSLKYLVRVRWWPVILLELMWNDPWWRSLLHLLFVANTYGKVSLWLWISLENLGNFSLLLCGHPGLWSFMLWCYCWVF